MIPAIRKQFVSSERICQRDPSQAGFSMIELLVAVGLVSILAAIAIPQYATYRNSAFSAEAKNDLRTVATAEEAYFVDNESYRSCTESDCSSVLPGVGLISPGVLLQITATTSGFSGTSSHARGTREVCTWDRSQGGLAGCV